MDRWRGRAALVTGASSGLGYAITEVLALSGVDVFGCARRVEEIEKLAVKVAQNSVTAGKITAIKCDLLDEQQILAMFQQIEHSPEGHVDILVNNAGMGSPDDLLTGRSDKWSLMLDLNIKALTISTREALCLMKRRNIDDGHIINISSTAGHNVAVCYPMVHYYASCKSMVLALTKALTAELRQQHSLIRVTSLSPGIVQSEFHEQRAALVDRENESAMKQLDVFHVARSAVVPLHTKDIQDAVIYILSAPPHVNIRELIIAPINQKT